MLVMSVDLRAARMLYLPEMQGRDIGNQEYGLILNLFDHDRDGNGEILFYQSGYEGASFSLIEYANEKFAPTGIELHMGC